MCVTYQVILQKKAEQSIVAGFSRFFLFIKNTTWVEFSFGIRNVRRGIARKPKNGQTD